MIIQKMNNVLVKHSKILFGIFTAVIIVSFVWFFTPGVDGSLFFGNKMSPDSKYGTVFDKPVTYRDLQDAMKTQSLIQAAYYQISPARIPEISEQESFQFAALLKAAEDMGYNVSDKELGDEIGKLPGFQENGKFSAALYKQYRDKMLEPAGLDFKDLEDAFRRMIMINKLMTSPIKNVVLTDGELMEGARQMLTTFTIRPVVFRTASFMSKVKLTEQEIKAFYDASKDAFLTEPEISGLLAAAPYADVKVNITDAQVKSEFEKNKALYRKNGKDAKLADVAKDIKAKLALEKQKDAALNKVRAFHKNLLDLQRMDKEQFQKDPKGVFKAQAAKAGLKVVGLNGIRPSAAEDPALYTENAVVKTLSSLKNMNSTTNVIVGERGVYKAMMTFRKEARVAPYADAKAKVELALRTKKAQTMADEALKNFRLKMKDSKKPAVDFDKYAKESGGTVEKQIVFKPFDLETNPYEFNMEMFPAMIQALTSREGELSKPSARGGIIAFVEKVALPTDKLIAEKKAELQPMLLARKQQIARMDFSRWLSENFKVIQRKDARAN